MGVPVVTIWCTTLWLISGSLLETFTTSEKSSRIALQLEAVEEAGPGENEGGEAEGGEAEGGEAISCGLLYCWWKPVTTEALSRLGWATVVAKDWPCLSTNLELAGSTMKPYYFKKSTPTMGNSQLLTGKAKRRSALETEGAEVFLPNT